MEERRVYYNYRVDLGDKRTQHVYHLFTLTDLLAHFGGLMSGVIAAFSAVGVMINKNFFISKFMEDLYYVDYGSTIPTEETSSGDNSKSSLISPE